MKQFTHLPLRMDYTTRDSGVPMRKATDYEMDLDKAAEYINELHVRLDCAERHAANAIETSKVLAGFWVATVISSAIIICVVALAK